MKSTTQTILTILGTGLIVAALLFAFELSRPDNAGKSLGEIIRFTTAPTNTNKACGTSSTILAATSSARQYLAIVNDSSSTVYLGLGVGAVGSNGIRLNANGGSYEITLDNLFTGHITCIASSTAIVTLISI